MDSKLVISIIVALLVGIGGGYVVSHQMNTAKEPNEVGTSQHEHMKMDGKEEMNHSHEMFMVKKDEAPTIALSVEEDAKSGWNVKIDTTKFIFTPDDVNGDNVVGEGHAHLYVDGEKVARLYGPYFHYDETFEGAKTFKVTLNANDHSEYVLDGEVIAATKEVNHAH